MPRIPVLLAPRHADAVGPNISPPFAWILRLGGRRAWRWNLSWTSAWSNENWRAPLWPEKSVGCNFLDARFGFDPENRRLYSQRSKETQSTQVWLGPAKEDFGIRGSKGSLQDPQCQYQASRVDSAQIWISSQGARRQLGLLKGFQECQISQVKVWSLRSRGSQKERNYQTS